MGKKLMMLLVGAAPLAVAVLVTVCPSAFGSASGAAVRCGGQPCDYSLSSSAFSLRFGQASFACEEARGRGRFTSATTSRLQLTLRTCREQNSPFKFTCVSSRDLSPRIRVTDLATYTIAGEGADKLQIAPFNVSLRCGDGQRWILEGFLEARIEPRQCGSWKKAYALPTELVAHGGDSLNSLYDVMVDGNGYGNLEFDRPWLFSFPEMASIGC